MNAWPVLTTRAERSRFKSAYGSYSGFEPSMIGFDGIVCVLLHDMARGGQQLLEHSLVGRCPICGHLARAYAVLEGEQYGNNSIEADHGRLKSRLRPMRGLKQLRC